jgi:hypothetical protein
MSNKLDVLTAALSSDVHAAQWRAELHRAQDANNRLQFSREVLLPMAECKTESLQLLVPMLHSLMPAGVSKAAGICVRVFVCVCVCVCVCV